MKNISETILVDTLIANKNLSTFRTDSILVEDSFFRRIVSGFVETLNILDSILARFFDTPIRGIIRFFPFLYGAPLYMRPTISGKVREFRTIYARDKNIQGVI